MMEVNEEHVGTLRNMGFPSESEIRKALRLGKNDLSEAVAILTNEPSSLTTTYDTLDDLADVEMKVDQNPPSYEDVYRYDSTKYYGPHQQYEQHVDSPETTASMKQDMEGGTSEDPADDSAPFEFPVANLFELENRVFTESWSIPYKREESLGKCLLASTRLAQLGLSDTHQHCQKFLERCMPEAFQKLMTSGAVHRWGADIQEGIYTMLQLLMDLVAARLQYEPVPIGLMQVLSMALNPETEFHLKNKSRPADHLYTEGHAVSPSSSHKQPYGWLINLINRFAEKKGFEYVKERMSGENLDAPAMAALMGPFGNCAEFLNSKVVQPMLAPGMEVAVKYVQGLTENDLKEKKVGSVCFMLATMKLLCLHMWPADVNAIDQLRLDVALRMLKAPHFNARMNSLKELQKLIEDSSGTKVAKIAIPPDRIVDWMVENKVLSIALEGNIDQVQYCDKVKNIVDFLGTRLSIDELTKIWKMQHSQTNVVIDNIHSIIAAAGVRFNPQQLEHLFLLIQKSWQVENDKMREKLLSLIGKIGKVTHNPKTTNRVLELLWDLAHLPALPTHLIELALEEHLDILHNSHTARERVTIKEPVKKSYVLKCVEDIKEGIWVLPALKQLLQISKNIAKHSIHKAEKGILQELNRNHEIIKLVTNSLVKFHKAAVDQAKERSVKLNPDMLVDGRYSHKDYVTVHLSFLQFILQEGILYLPWHRARDIWDILADSADACEWDRETCFEWFTRGISDLEQDTQSQLFQKELLRLDPTKLSHKGFNCYKYFFECVNQYEHKLKKSGTVLVVEKPELIGLDYLWEVCLNTPEESIATAAISLLLTMSYSNLSPRLKRDPVGLHKKFIQECNSRLEAAMIPLGGSAVAKALSSAAKIVTAATVPGMATPPSPSKSTKMVVIERLLLIAERYVLTVEELHYTPRTILPHGASFQGQPLNLYVTCESQKTDFNIKGHTNETIGSIRQKIANKLKHNPEQIQIVTNDKMLSPGKDQKLLHQLDFEDSQVLSVRTFSSTVSSQSTAREIQDSLRIDESPSSVAARQSYDLEQEKMMPGVVMATGGQVFEMLYQLADLDEPRITTRARNLLKLIPTDPSVEEALETLGQKGNMRPWSPDDASPRVSPRASPRKYTYSPTSTTAVKPVLKEMLRSLFDAGAPNMSTFRVLYNLEVLSGKLMPTVRDPASLQSARTFCEDFLNCGGLSLVVNLLQKEAIPSEVDYETRQGCYSIALQLARYLLCGEDVIGEDTHMFTGRRASTSSMGAAGSAAVGGPQSSAAGGSGPSSLDPPNAASRAIQTMGVTDFTETVACFMRVAWAAAAGRLHLVSSSQPIKETTGMYSGSRSRQSSSGSTASSGSDGEGQTLHAGVCVKQAQVSAKDTNIAKEALELLVTCLLLRSPLLASFYSLPCVSDFIIDILVGALSSEIRDMALDQFYLLSQTEVPSGENTGTQQTPHFFILHTLLKARLPFWVSCCSTRGASQRLLSQCGQYFELRCRLLGHLTIGDQKRLQVNVPSMLEDEIAWLGNFVPSENSEMKDTDNALLAGHLRLIRTLLTCEGVDKREFGKTLVTDLLHEFLFPASRLIHESAVKPTVENNSASDFTPKCSSTKSRVMAYEVLTELADGCLENLMEICMQLINMHHQHNPDLAHEWEYMPPVDGRSVAGFVGLRNGGATCYMNSVIQQLYMVPGITEAILSIEDEEQEEDGVFDQIQQAFGHLLESKLQYHVPERFWKVFKLSGMPINIREQHDALDFYQSLIDQVDEHLKKLGRETVFKKKFQGIYSDQKICKDCPHRYEREEVFSALNVTVKNATLQDSLDQFVKGELLEGDNAYFCEKCGVKRNTIKRMCIKTLPPVLCIQLKRFGYDWEANRALKFDDHFKFPWVLDMEPYTAEGMARREEQETANGSGGSGDSTSSANEAEADDEVFTVSIRSSNQINYELVGVVVHSGQANAGHYYSFIKDRRGTLLTNNNKGKWYKFNDTVVEEFEMTEAAMEAECFGGTYKAKVYDQASTYPEERLRYWNGYLLFYERMEEVRTPLSAKKTKVSVFKSQQEKSMSGSQRRDSLVELTELVHKGERKGIFTNKMPARIQQVVRDENMRFIQNKDVYDPEYFRFIRNLVSCNQFKVGHEQYSHICLQSLQMAIHFLANTYFRTKKKLRSDTGEWVAIIETLVQRCKDACLWLVEYLGSEQGRGYIKPFLLECPTREIRISFAKVLERTMASFFHHGGVATHKCCDELVENLLSMLNKDVADNCKTCTQYFSVLSFYVQMGTKACAHMFGRNAFNRLITFLLGPNVPTNKDQDSGMRRWSSLQARDFGPLHATLATLILNCDITQYQTEDPGNCPIRNPTTVVPQIYLKMSPEMHSWVFGAGSSRYIRESCFIGGHIGALSSRPGGNFMVGKDNDVTLARAQFIHLYKADIQVVLAMREVSGSTSQVVDMLVYCSFCNASFSISVLMQIMLQYASAPSNELTGLLHLLMQLLLLEDPLQMKRLQCVIDGYVDENDTNYEGMLAVIKLNHMNDSRRSYHCIKFLVNLAHKCTLAKDYLMQTPTKWEWAVNWLKKKMTEFWAPQTAAVTSNEDSDSRTFQRTVSAQYTLEEATALLTELGANDNEMDTNGQGSSDMAEQGEEQEGITFTAGGQQTDESTVDEVDERL